MVRLTLRQTGEEGLSYIQVLVHGMQACKALAGMDTEQDRTTGMVGDTHLVALRCLAGRDKNKPAGHQFVCVVVRWL